MAHNRKTYTQCLDKIGERLERANYVLNVSRRMATNGQMKDALSLAFTLAREVEYLALLARALPAYTGNPQAATEMEHITADVVPIEVGFTIQGWFKVTMPILLPKKAKGSPEYVRSILYPAMRRFFHGREPVCYPKCTLVMRHIYDQARPERGYRDHDNVEVKAVVDIMALYVMKDDSALRCNHYYCGIPGSRDQTEIYVIPQHDLMLFLEAEYAGESFLEIQP